jgi:hypothetical protein
MVRIEVEKENVKRLMIDGYIPTFEYLKKRLPNFKCGKQNPNGVILPHGSLGYYDVFQRYLHNSQLSERHLLRLFSNTVLKLRDGFCPFIDPRNITREMCDRRRESCRYFLVADHIGLGKGLLSQVQKKHPEIYSAIISEYDHEKIKGERAYIQTITAYNTKIEDNCGMLEECCEDWMTKLDFKVKDKKDYKDYQKFEQSIFQLLNSLKGYLDLW